MELATIKEQFSKVITYSQGIDDPDIDELFDKWYEAKLDWIHRFGNKLIYHAGPVEVHLDKEEQDKKLGKFIDRIIDNYCNVDLGNFLFEVKEDFWNNIITTDKWENKGIKKGMKITRAFKFFEHDKYVLDTIQTEASRLLQENKLVGQMYFSVHPLDYLSISCNAHNWRSCHALDGEYRAGNLSYMVDSSTVVCYISSGEDVNIEFFPSDIKWNSKKWRVLFYTDEEAHNIFVGKQYPYSSCNALDWARVYFIYDVLKQSEGRWSKWIKALSDYGGCYLSDKYVPYRGIVMRPVSELIQNGTMAMQFNDVLSSSCYTPYYTTRYGVCKPPPVKPIVVGGAVKCLQCGNDYITHHEHMRCKECEPDAEILIECTCCGSLHREDDITYDYQDDPVCIRCLDHKYVQCSRCGYYYPEEMKVYDRQLGMWVCDLCNEELIKERENNEEEEH
jgi:hypothetical protein